jgi:hypothetical protein
MFMIVIAIIMMMLAIVNIFPIILALMIMIAIMMIMLVIANYFLMILTLMIMIFIIVFMMLLIMLMRGAVAMIVAALMK